MRFYRMRSKKAQQPAFADRKGSPAFSERQHFLDPAVPGPGDRRTTGILGVGPKSPAIPKNSLISGFVSLIPAKNSLMSCVGNSTRNSLRSGAHLATNPYSKPEPPSISLYFPWITGNKVQRRVRLGLPPQPTFQPSGGFFMSQNLATRCKDFCGVARVAAIACDMAATSI
jgi:hypothetical protein